MQECDETGLLIYMFPAISLARQTWLQSQILPSKVRSYHPKSDPTIQSHVQPVANKDTPHEHGRLRDDLTHVAALDLHSCAVQDAGSLESGIVA